ncbi:MAG: hypothetical protein ACRDZX_17790, partial [Acidimicrobiales bacterium]
MTATAAQGVLRPRRDRRARASGRAAAADEEGGAGDPRLALTQYKTPSGGRKFPVFCEFSPVGTAGKPLRPPPLRPPPLLWVAN